MEAVAEYLVRQRGLQRVEIIFEYDGYSIAETDRLAILWAGPDQDGPAAMPPPLPGIWREE